MVKKIGFFFFICLLSVEPAICAQEAKQIRVAVLQGAPSVYLRIRGGFEICDLDSGRQIYKGRSLKSRLVKVVGGQINFPQLNIAGSRLKIRLLRGGIVYVNNRTLRGGINLICKDTKEILVVNVLELEDYCQGVLPYEVASWWPFEALKAQAVVARTYALYHMQFTGPKDYDVTADIYSQVYGGKVAERWRTNRAVALTRNEVLLFQGNIFPAYYHATCSGHTEDASSLWSVDLAPLKGVTCGYCLKSPHFAWQVSMPSEKMMVRLKEKGFAVGGIDTIEITGRNASGRITGLAINGQDKTFNISAKDFRQALGPNIIRSTNFTLRVISDVVYFEGLGWGHGVGLCQWGAYFMAQKGFRYREILKYYFPQSELSLSN